MAVSWITMARDEPTAYHPTPLTELVSWLASDLEASLGHLARQLEEGALEDAAHELLAVRRMVTDLVELHGGTVAMRGGEFDLAYEDLPNDEPIG